MTFNRRFLDPGSFPATLGVLLSLILSSIWVIILRTVPIGPGRVIGGARRGSTVQGVGKGDSDETRESTPPVS